MERGNTHLKVVSNKEEEFKEAFKNASWPLDDKTIYKVADKWKATVSQNDYMRMNADKDFLAGATFVLQVMEGKNKTNNEG